MDVLAARIADNVAGVRERIAAAAGRSGRDAREITLVAVTKYIAEPAVRAAVAAGCTDLGESRPQDLWARADTLADLPVRWHMIGHLQRNKIRRTLPIVSLLHSVDSLRLLEAIDREAAEIGRPARGLLEVNVSGEPAKHGLTFDQVEPLLARLAEFPHVSIEGLMGMAGLIGGLDAARRQFAQLREVRERWQRVCPPTVALGTLSMGMSSDFEVAIEEGATIIRVGSALWKGV